MSNTNTGGPAFPESGPRGQASWGEGMSLRDYFAAKAMQGEMVQGIHERDFDWTAARCYKVADAMLAARSAT